MITYREYLIAKIQGYVNEHPRGSGLTWVEEYANSPTAIYAIRADNTVLLDFTLTLSSKEWCVSLGYSRIAPIRKEFTFTPRSAHKALYDIRTTLVEDL